MEISKPPKKGLVSYSKLRVSYKTCKLQFWKFLSPTPNPITPIYTLVLSEGGFFLCTALNTCTFSRPEFEDWQKKSQKRVKAILHPKTSCLVSPGGEVKTGHRHDPKKSQNMGRPRLARAAGADERILGNYAVHSLNSGPESECYMDIPCTCVPLCPCPVSSSNYNRRYPVTGWPKAKVSKRFR